MKRLLLAAAVAVAVLIQPIGASAAPLMRNTIQACGFGAASLAATTYYGLTPALATGSLVLPVTEAIAANALIGCGIGVVGAASATVLGWVYDVIF